ncbi:very short patch repair endonuclease [Paenibacillus elgii]|uniref:very short patch repair endonuclease n=1 Tax=Paenibacillus elgii TaxID=189691 RepID=UPI00203E13DC|nr:very short patch repair endonuclease [Paenibacillus elgii]MCM3269095.1 very short patch repair endonuclease [Paenibacillus elgii]
MADKISKERRSENMKAIRSVSILENEVTRALWLRGFRFRKNVKGMVGKPDIVIKKYKVVIFIDSCFWHHCPVHGRIPKSNTDFWTKKIERNIERDHKVTMYYTGAGWNLYRIWEHEVKENFLGTIDKIAAYIEQSKLKYL